MAAPDIERVRFIASGRQTDALPTDIVTHCHARKPLIPARHLLAQKKVCKIYKMFMHSFVVVILVSGDFNAIITRQYVLLQNARIHQSIVVLRFTFRCANIRRTSVGVVARACKTKRNDSEGSDNEQSTHF